MQQSNIKVKAKSIPRQVGAEAGTGAGAVAGEGSSSKNKIHGEAYKKNYICIM